jgi:hypothetical protein
MGAPKKEQIKDTRYVFRPKTVIIELIEAHMAKYNVTKTKAIEYYIIQGASIEPYDTNTTN